MSVTAGSWDKEAADAANEIGQLALPLDGVGERRRLGRLTTTDRAAPTTRRCCF